MSSIAEVNIDTNKALVADYVAQVWNGQNVEALERFVAKDLIQHNPHLADGRVALADFLTGFFAQVPQGRFAIERLIGDGDLVVTHALFRTEPDDRGMAVVDIYRIADGRIAEHWDVKESVPAEAANANPIV